MDLYTPTTKLSTYNLRFNFTAAGVKHFRLRVTGKNPSSLGYSWFLDYIRIDKE